MNRSAVFCVAIGMVCQCAAMAQAGAPKAPAPAAQSSGGLANEMAKRLGEQLHAKTVVGEPVKAGSVTLIPILMVEVNFAGGSIPAPAANAPGFDGFLMSGEARPLGFVAITAKGTRFIPVVETPAK